MAETQNQKDKTMIQEKIEFAKIAQDTFKSAMAVGFMNKITLREETIYSDVFLMNWSDLQKMVYVSHGVEEKYSSYESDCNVIEKTHGERVAAFKELTQKLAQS